MDGLPDEAIAAEETGARRQHSFLADGSKGAESASAEEGGVFPQNRSFLRTLKKAPTRVRQVSQNPSAKVFLPPLRRY